MALVVETGSGSPTANSYLSEADANTYWTDHGDPSTWVGDTAAKETALLMATQYLDAVYNLRWRGTRKVGTQRLAWPREGIEDESGFSVPSDSLPRGVTEATAEAALRHFTEINGLMPDAALDGGIRRKKSKVGSLEEDIEYVGEKQTLPKFTIIDSLLADLIHDTVFVERS